MLYVEGLVIDNGIVCLRMFVFAFDCLRLDQHSGPASACLLASCMKARQHKITKMLVCDCLYLLLVVYEWYVR